MRHGPRAMVGRAAPGLPVRSRPRIGRRDRSDRPHRGASLGRAGRRPRGGGGVPVLRRIAAMPGGRRTPLVRHGLADMYGFVSVERPPGLWGGYATHQHLGPDSRVTCPTRSIRWWRPCSTRWARASAGCDGTRRRPRPRGGRPRPRCPRPVGVRGGEGRRRGIRDAHRRVAARRRPAALGPSSADLTVDVRTEDPGGALRAATGEGADVVVDVTAKAPEALGQAVAIARDGAAIVVAGARGVAGTPGFWPDLVVYKELRILGALGVDTASYVAALDLLASGRYPFAEAAPRAGGPRRCRRPAGADGGRGGGAGPGTRRGQAVAVGAGVDAGVRPFAGC